MLPFERQPDRFPSRWKSRVMTVHSFRDIYIFFIMASGRQNNSLLQMTIRSVNTFRVDLIVNQIPCRLVMENQ